MKLTVLGGAAAGGNPGQGCSGYLVQAGETSIVLDLGPGTLPELRLHADFRSIDAIVVSHLHLDHVLDLLALRYALAYNPEPRAWPLPLWLPPGGVSFFSRLAEALADAGDEGDYFAVFAMSDYDPDGKLAIGSLSVTFAPTVHYVPCWAMRVSSSGVAGDLVYTADTGPAANLAPFAAGAAVLLAEAGALNPESESAATRGHLTASEAGQLASESGACRLVLTHLWSEQDPERAYEQASENFGKSVLRASPGLVVEW